MSVPLVSQRAGVVHTLWLQLRAVKCLTPHVLQLAAILETERRQSRAPEEDICTDYLNALGNHDGLNPATRKAALSHAV